jgi:hypothetical protein
MLTYSETVEAEPRAGAYSCLRRAGVDDHAFDAGNHDRIVIIATADERLRGLAPAAIKGPHSRR